MIVKEFYEILIQNEFSFTTDSRKISKGCVFFALKGENFNGNQFAQQALNDGAAFAVVDEQVGSDERFIRVKDVLLFMQELAIFHRNCYDIPVIAIGGSNGKTTTKNLIYAVLSEQFKTHCTKGNFNNHIGVPITLLQTPKDAEMAIIEVGTNNPGEIAALCKIVNPNFGLVTNIGKEHLEGFGSLEAVAKEESEVYLYLLQNKGKAFVNSDDDWLVRMTRNLESIKYSKSDVEILSLVPHISFIYNNLTITSPLMGDYNLDNILTAISIGAHFGLSADKIKTGIESYSPENNRSQLIEYGTNTVWLDAYNANPSSMEKAIENFAKMPQENKVLVLGDMFEMGDHAAEEHVNVLNFAQKFNFSQILVLGHSFTAAAKSLGVPTFENIDSLIQEISSQKFETTAFLIKGSRGMKMERVLDAFN